MSNGTTFKLHWSELPAAVLALLRRGTVIPAHPLALDASRTFDERRQRALTRYYLDAGVGGLAVGVHATQFAIREHGLYEPVLRLAMQTASDWCNRPLVMIAGIAGRTDQARREAAAARDLGYSAGLVSLADLAGCTEDELVAHCVSVSLELPLVGFYLQQSVGGPPLDASFWRRFAALENVIAIKVAPFNRYATLDVLRGVVDARAEHRIALYTGNDDHILLDLLMPFVLRRDGEDVSLRFRGGLLGHWSVWTKRAVELFERVQEVILSAGIDDSLLALQARITDANSAFFDAAHNFAGCIAGCHEVLRRQGLLVGTWCLDPHERLSPGQAQEIDRVYDAYPELNDDEFVRGRLGRWLA
jgi:dihydrodipicolinate synthase/N-acetylneuraminate lyase